jgi:hypothetical protein
MCVRVCFFGFSFFFFLSSPWISFTLLASVVGTSREEDRLQTGGPRAHFYFFLPTGQSRAAIAFAFSLSLSLYVYIKVVSVRTFCAARCADRKP